MFSSFYNYSMYQTIGEKIAVAGVYEKGKFMPKKFLWKNAVYPVQEITISADVKDGVTRKRMYGVVSGENVYRLMFNRDTEIWTLAEVWHE